MKTKEFIEKVKELGFEVMVKKYNGEKCIQLVDIDGCTVSKASTECIYEGITAYNGFTVLPKDLKKQLFNLLVEYSSTPIEEREEEKKHYLKHKFFKDSFCRRYLFLNKHTQEYNIGSNYEYGSYQTKFTQKEIDEIKKKFGTDLDDFEMIEVE